MISDRELPANIEATNEANRLAMELQGRLLAFFRPYVGKKVAKADGTLLAKISEKLKDFLGKLPCTPSLHVCRLSSVYSMDWTVRVSKNYGEGMSGGATYAVANVYVGELSGDTLTKLGDPVVLRTDYTVESIQEARKNARAAKDAYEKAKGECFPFGEW